MTVTEGTPAPAAGGRSNPFARMIGALIAPVETFREIASRPDWLVIFLVIMVLSVVSTLVVMPHLDLERQLRSQFEKQGMSQEKVDAALDRVEKFQKFSAFIPVVFTPIFFLVIAGVFLLAFKLFGGEGGFGHYFSVSLYAWMPQLLKGIILTVLIFNAGKLTPNEMGLVLKSNLGFLADPEEAPVPFALLISLDVFAIWTLVLMTIGFAWVSRLSRTKVAVTVVSLWVVTLLFKVGMAALQSLGGKN